MIRALECSTAHTIQKVAQMDPGRLPAPGQRCWRQHGRQRQWRTESCSLQSPAGPPASLQRPLDVKPFDGGCLIPVPMVHHVLQRDFICAPRRWVQWCARDWCQEFPAHWYDCRNMPSALVQHEPATHATARVIRWMRCYVLRAKRLLNLCKHSARPLRRRRHRFVVATNAQQSRGPTLWANTRTESSKRHVLRVRFRKPGSRLHLYNHVYNHSCHRLMTSPDCVTEWAQ